MSEPVLGAHRQTRYEDFRGTSYHTTGYPETFSVTVGGRVVSDARITKNFTDGKIQVSWWEGERSCSMVVPRSAIHWPR